MLKRRNIYIGNFPLWPETEQENFVKMQIYLLAENLYWVYSWAMLSNRETGVRYIVLWQNWYFKELGAGDSQAINGDRKSHELIVSHFRYFLDMNFRF